MFICVQMQALYAKTWLITEDGLKTIQTIANRKLQGESLSKENLDAMKLSNSHTNRSTFSIVSQDNSFVTEYEAQEFSNSNRKNNNGKAVQVIKIVGPMFKRASMLDAISGAKSTQDVINSINEANDNADIEAIVLDIDSPGGTVDGTEALANTVKNSKKPIVAYANGLCASAALWVSTQAEETIIAGKTTHVGSLGTVFGHVSEEGWLDMQGLKVETLTSKGTTEKVVGPSHKNLSEEDRTKLVNHLTRLNNVFKAAVKSGRGELKEVNGLHPESGAIYIGQEAIKANLADRIGTLEDAVKRASGMARGRIKTKKQKSQIKSETKVKEMKNLFPVLVSMFSLFASEKNVKTFGASEEIVLTKSELEKFEQELGELGTEKTKAMDSLAERSNELSAANEKISELEAKGDDNAELETLKTNKGELEASVTELEGQKEALNAEITELKADKEGLSESNTELEASLKAKDTSLEEANAKLEKANGENEALKEANVKLAGDTGKIISAAEKAEEHAAADRPKNQTREEIAAEAVHKAENFHKSQKEEA